MTLASTCRWFFFFFLDEFIMRSSKLSTKLHLKWAYPTTLYGKLMQNLFPPMPHLSPDPRGSLSKVGNAFSTRGLLGIMGVHKSKSESEWAVPSNRKRGLLRKKIVPTPKGGGG